MSNYSYESESLLDTLKNNKRTAIGLAIFLIALALIFFVIVPKIYAPQVKQAQSFTEIIRESDITRGKKDSNIIVVLFEDPQCPGCQSLSKTESANLEKYRDRVRFVYKYVRAVPGHTFAQEANSYIYAAEELAAKGYEYVEQSYKTTTNPQALTKSEFLSYATSEPISLDATKLSEKANSKEIREKVAQQQSDFEFKFPAIEGFTNTVTRISGTPGGFVVKDGKVVRITSGDDKSVLVDKTKGFTVYDIGKYLDELLKN
jgi:Thioredoxin